jgi:hypothetical protein
MRERFILNVAGLRYEFDLIAVLTSLPPAGRPKIAVLPPSDGKRKRRAVPRTRESLVSEPARFGPPVRDAQ